MNPSTVTIVGNLTDDPELRYLENGTAVAKFRVASTPRIPDGNGGFKDGAPMFMDVTVWRQLAEHVAESLGKGARVLCYGTLRLESWEEKDGTKRSKHTITADAVGAELTFATAAVTRTKGSGGGGGSRNDDSDPEWAGASKSRPSSSAAGAAKSGKPPAVANDDPFSEEPPF